MEPHTLLERRLHPKPIHLRPKPSQKMFHVFQPWHGYFIGTSLARFHNSCSQYSRANTRSTLSEAFVPPRGLWILVLRGKRPPVAGAAFVQSSDRLVSIHRGPNRPINAHSDVTTSPRPGFRRKRIMGLNFEEFSRRSLSRNLAHCAR